MQVDKLISRALTPASVVLLAAASIMAGCSGKQEPPKSAAEPTAAA